MKSSKEILDELQSARRKDDREQFQRLVFELVQLHRGWLEYRYGNFDEQIEDSLGHAFVEALDHADFDSIMHPDAYFKTVAVNHIRNERRKSMRAESLEDMEAVGVIPQDTAIDAREAMAIEEYHQLLLELDLPGLMENARRELEQKASLQAYILTVRAENTKLSYTRIAEDLGMGTDAKAQTYLRVQHLRGRESYARNFLRMFAEKVGERRPQYEEALMHYLTNPELYPPIPGISESAMTELGGE